ncbi:hypothetical protein BDR06DRAFT_955626 [Suillus hirtellus]|nr:hypothetical protein BDR06DRAFT_955626 [Suillus hirtellus]
MSALLDKTERPWNLDTDISVGPPLQHDEGVECATLFGDGTVGTMLVTASDKDVYVWHLQPILERVTLKTYFPFTMSQMKSYLSRQLFLYITSTSAEYSTT